ASLSKLASSQRAFNGYMRAKVARVSKRLSSARASGARVRTKADRATFSLAVELLSQPKMAHRGKVRAALLRLASTAQDVEVRPDVVDSTGRSGIAVDDYGEEIVFDPETFVILETRALPDQQAPGSVLPTEPTQVQLDSTVFEYAIVDQLRKRA